MDFKTLINDFNRLGAGNKLVFFGSLIAFFSVFLPWYQIRLVGSEDFRIESIPVISNGFTKFPIFGLLCAAFAIVALVIFARDFFGIRKTGGFSHGKIWMAIGGEMLFVLIIALFVFLSEKQTIPSADMRFGLFFSLFGHCLILFGGYLVEQAQQQKETLAAFHPTLSAHHGGINIRAEEPEIHSNQLSFSEAHAKR